MSSEKIDALLALRREGRFLVGRERITLLEAVAEHGSISKAAKALGFSYKTAWDAVNAINNLLPSPAFVTKAGGRGGGGGAEVTAEGRRLIETFHALEQRLSRLSSAIAEIGLEGNEELLLFGVGGKISARNIFQVEVEGIDKGPVDVQVVLRASSNALIHSIVTNQATNDLELKTGKKILAIIKSSFVKLAEPDGKPGEKNFFPGRVTARTDADRRAEVLIDIGGGKTMTAVVPREQADRLKAAPGTKLAACFDAADVMLAAS